MKTQGIEDRWYTGKEAIAFVRKQYNRGLSRNTLQAMREAGIIEHDPRRPYRYPERELIKHFGPRSFQYL